MTERDWLVLTAGILLGGTVFASVVLGVLLGAS